ncbi:hypothetical protein RJ639_005094 [Escallonia herrerae]|uniref:GH18 domain-containing protein n=1 Tax=Escallonia herrerae TaxID=1293975 RepID=A0AA88W2J3_9ASTE|nr:hypothetical protein RJ639_005094 [Escallonia herrerae]
MISTKTPEKVVRKWQDLVVIRRKRISLTKINGNMEMEKLGVPLVADKGYFVVYSDDGRRFVIPLLYLNNEVWRQLLEMSEEECGLPGDSLITLPCDAFLWQYIISLIHRGVAEAMLRKHWLCNYVDWISPMCFDYCASSNPITWEHAALYDPKSNTSTSFGIESWIQVNVPPEKIVMGMPLYGKTWTLQDPNVNGVGAPAVGAGPRDGILVYSQIVEFNSENNATICV